MEASALTHHARSPQALLGRSPLLRLQGDEKLIALIREDHPGAFDALVHRYQARLLSFLRHMLGSTEDAEDVLQEVFASAYNAIRADDRPINARPWLYRIARNRALNHLRRPVPAGQDTMDVFERAAGETTADAVHKREDFRLLISDVQGLPESQRTALLMREIDALSYEQIAEAMDTTVPSVKSLLVRARVGLAEAAEARMLSCAEVRLSLAEAAEGIVAKPPAPIRRHVKTCERCRVFRTELRRTTRALTAIYPAGPLVVWQKLVWGKVSGAGSGGGAGAGAGTSGSGFFGGSSLAGGSVWGGGTAASGSALGGIVGGGVGTGGLLSSGAAAIATKAAAGLVAAAVVTAGAVEVAHLAQEEGKPGPTPLAEKAQPPDALATPPAEAVAAAAAGAPQGPTEAKADPTAASTEPAAADTAASTGAPAPADPAASPPAADPVSTGAAPDATASDSGSGGSAAPPVDTGGSGGAGGSSPGDPGDGAGTLTPPPSDGGGTSSPPPSGGPPGDPAGSSPGTPGPLPVAGESVP